MVAEKFDEECLLKDIQASKLAAAITKLTWNWNNYSNPLKEAHELMTDYRKLSVEISEYNGRIGSELSDYQRNQIEDTMYDLEKLIPALERKITPSEFIEKKFE